MSLQKSTGMLEEPSRLQQVFCPTGQEWMGWTQSFIILGDLKENVSDSICVAHHSR